MINGTWWENKNIKIELERMCKETVMTNFKVCPIIYQNEMRKTMRK
jgi:hypothetical protein